MTARLKTRLKYSFSLFLTVLFLYLAFRGTDFERLIESIRDVNYLWLVFMFVCLMISHVFRSWRWRYMLDPIKPNIGFRNLFSGVMVGYMVNNVLPRAGELVRPYTIGKLESIPKSAALGTILGERILEMVAFVSLVVVIPFVYDGPLRDSFPWLEEAGVLISIITLITVVLMTTLMVRRDWTDVALRFVSRFLPSGIARLLDTLTHSFLDGFLFLKRPGGFLMIFVLSVLVWLMYIIMMQTAFYAFDLRQQLGFRAAMVVLAISSIGVAMPTPGATGTYHAFTTEALCRLFFIPREIALSYAFVTHAVNYIGVTIIGLYYFLQNHIRVSEAVGTMSERAS